MLLVPTNRVLFRSLSNAGYRKWVPVFGMLCALAAIEIAAKSFAYAVLGGIGSYVALLYLNYLYGYCGTRLIRIKWNREPYLSQLSAPRYDGNMRLMFVFDGAVDVNKNVGLAAELRGVMPDKLVHIEFDDLGNAGTEGKQTITIIVESISGVEESKGRYSGPSYQFSNAQFHEVLSRFVSFFSDRGYQNGGPSGLEVSILGDELTGSIGRLEETIKFHR